MRRICEQTTELSSDSHLLLPIRQDVLQPIEGLDNAHGRTVCPIKPAGSGWLKVNLLFAEFDWLQARVGEHLDACRHGRRESQIVSGGHAVDDVSDFVPARYGADHLSVIWNRWATGEANRGRTVIEAPIDASERARRRKALKRLVDSGSAPARGEDAGGPNRGGVRCGTVLAAA